jgi:hypothetical protein
MDMAVQHGDIAVADNPFGMLRERGKVESVDNPHGSIAPSATQNGRNTIVIEESLQEGGTMAIGTGQLTKGVI